ncbi:MAG: glycosyltransferase family 2 protein [Victivallaceae bacterium]|nr:glycosyltransferase family 2 protein [Victivallaceae bacterium]
MVIFKFLFWFSIALGFYTYVGYGVIIIVSAYLKQLFQKKESPKAGLFEPRVALFIAAFNEEKCIAQKIENCFSLDYPQGKIKIVVVTDGSTDNSVNIIANYPAVVHLQQKERRGKMAAINFGMQFVDSEITIFSDANSILNRSAIRELVNKFYDDKVALVSGEKRIVVGHENESGSQGEASYWRYESQIKKAEALLNSCVAVDGGLFAIRTQLFDVLPDDTILDDLAISIKLGIDGYSIQYAANAIAIENASLTISDEFERKVRIASGHLQLILRMPAVFNIFRHGVLSLRYFSHKFLRSFVMPLCIIIAFASNLILSITQEPLYVCLLTLQCLFYMIAILGFYFRNSKCFSKLLHIPFYVCMINLAAWVGVFHYITGKHSVRWKKARR